jgi:hypothetical protein
MAASWSVYPVGCPGYSALAKTKACQRALGSVKTLVGLKFKSHSLKSSSCWVKKSGYRFQPVVSLASVEENGESKDATGIDGSSVETEKVNELPPKEPERDFAGTQGIPVYVMMPLGIINEKCELVDPETLKKKKKTLENLQICKC